MNSSCFKLYRAYFISFNSSNVANFFWSWILRLHRSLRKEKQSRCLVFTSSSTREIRHFHVVVVQWRQGHIQKSVMHEKSCCFATLNQLLCCRSRWRRRRRCLSSVLGKSEEQLTSTDCWPTVGRLSAVCWPTVGRLSADSWPTVGGGELFFTFTPYWQLCRWGDSHMKGTHWLSFQQFAFFIKGIHIHNNFFRSKWPEVLIPWFPDLCSKMSQFLYSH